MEKGTRPKANIAIKNTYDIMYLPLPFTWIVDMEIKKTPKLSRNDNSLLKLYASPEHPMHSLHIARTPNACSMQRVMEH